MAKKRKQVIKSFRALVGVSDNGSSMGRGPLLLDSNDTNRHYAFFSITEGLSPEGEDYCLDFLKKNVEPFMDVYRRADMSRPGAYIKNLIGTLMKELISEGYVSQGDNSYSLALVMVINDHLYIGRLNSFPVYYLKDRNFRQVLNPVKALGPESIQVVGTSLSDGDMLVLGSKNSLKNITELELKSVILAEDDLTLACSRINLQANKYEENKDPRLMAVKFLLNHEVSQSLFTRRNTAILGSMFMVILVAFLWGEIVRYMKAGPMAFIMNKEKSVVRQVIEKVSMPRASSYNMELVYDGLAVPYDITVADDGTIYIVDDKEEGILRYQPGSKRHDIIGEQVKLVFPTGIDLMGDKLYVVDFSYQVHKVFIFDKNGRQTGKIPDDMSKMVSLNNPKAVEGVESDSSVYICDRGNNRVLKFDNEGTYQSTINMPAGFREPNGIAITNGGIIYLTLKISGQIGTISTKNTVNEFTLFEEVAGGGTNRVSLAKPSGIAVDRKGNVYVADTANQRIVVTNQMGKLLASIGSEKVEEFKTYYPMSLKLGPKGDYVYVVASNRYSYDVASGSKCNGKIWKFKI